MSNRRVEIEHSCGDRSCSSYRFLERELNNAYKKSNTNREFLVQRNDELSARIEFIPLKEGLLIWI